MAAREAEALAARLVVGLDGAWPSPAETIWLRRWRPAGVILFSRNVTGPQQLAALCTCLHRLVPDLEIVADHEGGPVSQLSAAVGRAPAPWALGVLDDPDLTRRVHRETALRCRRLGLDRLLAPCADVLVERHNPVIGSRAFGADCAGVERHVAAAARGLLDGGVQACVKHWPGHGGSRTDSHLGMSLVGDGALPEPFLAGLRGGADAVMVGHLWPGAGGDGSAGTAGDLPASLDAARLQAAKDLLTGPDGEMRRFYADDVTMGALRGAMAGLGVRSAAGSGMIEPAELEIGWLQAIAAAGCDRLLVRGIPWRAFPVPAGGGADPDLEGRDFEETQPLPVPDVYVEARARLRQAAGVSGFAAPNGELLWLDLTPTDRWQAAAGQDPTAPSLGESLDRDFAVVKRIVPSGSGPVVPGGAFDRLLVTSHRPLFADPDVDPDTNGWWSRIRRSLAVGGRAVVMGHPSLASDLAGILGSDLIVGSNVGPNVGIGGGWSVAALFDTTAADYDG